MSVPILSLVFWHSSPLQWLKTGIPQLTDRSIAGCYYRELSGGELLRYHLEAYFWLHFFMKVKHHDVGTNFLHLLR
jgi:hypothetical protein